MELAADRGVHVWFDCGSIFKGSRTNYFGSFSLFLSSEYYLC